MLSINQSLRFIYLSSHNIRVKKNPKQNKLFTESSVDDELRSLTINQSINQSVNQSEVYNDIHSEQNKEKV